MSPKLKNTCLVELYRCICEQAQGDTIPANMWLTVLDVAYRTDDKQLEKLATQRFKETFDFESLRTVKLDYSEKAEGTGRKVKKTDLQN